MPSFAEKVAFLFLRGVTELDVVVYTSEKLLRQYKSTLYVIFVAIDLILICPCYFIEATSKKSWEVDLEGANGKRWLYWNSSRISSVIPIGNADGFSYWLWLVIYVFTQLWKNGSFLWNLNLQNKEFFKEPIESLEAKGRYSYLQHDFLPFAWKCEHQAEYFLNRSSRRKRGMASTPLFIIPDFFCIFQTNLL